VPHAAHHGLAARLLDLFLHGLAGPEIVQDALARMVAQDLSREQRRDHVSGNALALLVDEAHAVRVAVVRHAQVRPLRHHPLLQVLHG